MLKFTPTSVICETFWRFYIKSMIDGPKKVDPWGVKTWESYCLHNFVEGFNVLHSICHIFCWIFYFLHTYGIILLKFSNKNRDKKKWYRVCSIFREIGESYKSLDFAWQKNHWFCVANKNLSFMNLIMRELEAIYSEQKVFCNSWKNQLIKNIYIWNLLLM